jgi:LCP family protein required for cell wall assembly
MYQHQKFDSETKSTPPNWLLISLAVAFVLAASATAVLTFFAVRDFVVSRGIKGVAGISPSSEQEASPNMSGVPSGVADNVPLQPQGGPTPEPWDGSSRLNILVMGLDYRDWQDGNDAPRTDTMILVSVDPESRSVGILSIPRDLWVSIPGFDPNKINMAYRLGELYKVSGEGPGLAMRTVGQFLGMQINYYAQIDFKAFERFIDEIGGVKIDVPEEIQVDPLGDGNTKNLKPGVQVLPGDLALAYARARNTIGSDFDRAERQQQVILGVRNRVLTQDTLLSLIRKSPILYQEISSGVRTNLSLSQAIQLGWLAPQIPEESIKRGVIGPNQVEFATSFDGQDILRPLPEEIRLLRDEIFTSSGPITPAATEADPQKLMQAEDAKVSVLNGTLTPGLAAQTANYLENQGIQVVDPGNASERYDFTTVIDYTGNPSTINYLVELLNVSSDRIYHSYEPDSQADVVLLLGEDWANNNSLP